MANNKKGSQEDSITIGMSMTEETTDKKDSLAVHPKNKKINNQQEDLKDSHVVMREENKPHVKEIELRDKPDKTMGPDKRKLSKN